MLDATHRSSSWTGIMLRIPRRITPRLGPWGGYLTEHYLTPSDPAVRFGGGWGAREQWGPCYHIPYGPTYCQGRSDLAIGSHGKHLGFGPDPLANNNAHPQWLDPTVPFRNTHNWQVH